MLCNGNVPDAISPINFKNDSFCPTSSRDFSTLGNKSIMSLISITLVFAAYQESRGKNC